MTDSANDNEVDWSQQAPGEVLTPEMRDMLNQCDKLGLGTEFVVNVMRSQLKQHSDVSPRVVEIALQAFGRVLDRHR